MTHPTPDATGSSRAIAPAYHGRQRALVDPRFQLKYTGLLVGVVLAVMAALGVVIWRTSGAATASARLAASEAEHALEESRSNSRITRLTALMQADNAAVRETIERELADVDRQAERDATRIRLQRAEIEGKRHQMLYVLVGGGLGLLALLGFLGIYITQKIVGPVFKLKRLLRRVGTGRLVVRERLRRGDELADLFETFLQMTHSLSALQHGRLATLDATIRKAEATGASREVLEGLQALRAQLCLGLATSAVAPATAVTPKVTA